MKNNNEGWIAACIVTVIVIVFICSAWAAGNVKRGCIDGIPFHYNLKLYKCVEIPLQR